MADGTMTLDTPWKIAALIGLLAFLRIFWGLWREAPSRRLALELLDSGLIAFLLVFVLVRPLVVQAFFIPSGSMLPTLRPGDRILVNKFIYRLSPPQRGDVIVFNAPPYALSEGDGQKDYVKRLIGLPGDVIKIRSYDGVYVNNRRLDDPPGVPAPQYDWPVDEFNHQPLEEGHTVGKDAYFVLGDNRNDSNDSHQWRDSITGQSRPDLASWRVLGKAMVSFWPPGRLGLVSDHVQVHPSKAPRQVVTAPSADFRAGKDGHEPR